MGRRRILTWRRLFLFSLILGLLLGIVLGLLLLDEPGLTLPPREDDRVHHPTGFSIIKPAGWHVRVMAQQPDELDSINISPGNPRIRYAQSLHVIRLARQGQAPQDLHDLTRGKSYTAGTFQGTEASIYIGPQGEYDSWQAIVRRNGEWYRIALLLPNPSDLSRGPPPTRMPPERWLPFIESFRVDTPPASVPTTQASGNS